MKKSILLSLLLILLASSFTHAQLQRKRANPNAHVEEIFWAPTLISTSTVSTLSAGDLNYAVKHNFGQVDGGIKTLYGLDEGGAEIRLGFAYGVTDRWQIGIGRTNIQDLVDLNSTYRIVRQTRNGSVPVDIAIRGIAGIITEEISIDGFEEDFSDRLNYVTQLMIARKFSESFSFQVAPMYAHFNTTIIELEDQSLNNDFVAVGLIGSYRASDLLSFSAEYLPVLSGKNSGTYDHFGTAVEFNTGGHVFQVYLTSGQAFTEQQLIAGTQNNFLDGEVQFGFTINRVFSLGGK